MKLGDKAKVIANVDYCGNIGKITDISEDGIRLDFVIYCEECGHPERTWCYYSAEEIKVITND